MPRIPIAGSCRPPDGSCAISRRRKARTATITVRNDTGVYEGGEISMFYDPMIAKLCTHAPTRLEAIDAMDAALDEFRIEGIRHNIAFLNAIMHHPRFRSGAITTAFIAEEYPDGFHGRPLDDAAHDASSLRPRWPLR